MTSKRTALLTGASRGIGAAIAERLTADGIDVIAPGRSSMDLESPDSVGKYLSQLNRSVDILINDAGINRIAVLEDMDYQTIQATMQINLLAPLHLIQALTPGMKEKRFGRVVNISSIWSVVGKAGRTSYSMSKSAINAMTRNLAIELAPFNILVNAVAPGYVLTELTRQNNSEAELELISGSIPIRRLAEPDEIANVVAFLCSEKNTYLTGQTIIVDGGYTCQ